VPRLYIVRGFPNAERIKPETLMHFSKENRGEDLLPGCVCRVRGFHSTPARGMTLSESTPRFLSTAFADLFDPISFVSAENVSRAEHLRARLARGAAPAEADTLCDNRSRIF
jgi:hypothetical protein